MKNLKCHTAQTKEKAEASNDTVVIKDLGGYFRWFVMGNGTVLVDPKYLEEYQLSRLVKC